MEGVTPSRLRTGSIWSQLLEELLHQIFRRLEFPGDRARFGLVCSSWRSVRNHYRPSPLYLSTDYERNIRLLYLRNVGQSKPLPSNLRLPCSSGKLFCCFGWLVVFKDHGIIHLGNPLTGEWINLPPLSDASYMYNVALSSSPTSGDCMVICNYNDVDMKNKLACRKLTGDDKKWFEFDHMYRSAVSMAFHSGRLYVLKWDYTTMVYAFDHPHPIRICSINRVDQLTTIQQHRNLTVHLTESFGGELLLGAKVEFIKLLDRVVSPRFMSTEIERVEFQVFKLEGERWVRLTSTDLQDRVILFCDRGMESVCTKEVLGLGFKACRIYDLNIISWEYSFEEDGKFRVRKPWQSAPYGSVWFQPQGW